ncbi:MAG: hypothetical protein HKN71_07585 [Gemmatimonadetes bacterium]|nr:hypothetical protein [Gemmatimonadota bacterium]
MSRRVLLAPLMIAALLSTSTPMQGQSPSRSVATGVHVESFRFDEPDVAGAETLSLVTVPFAVRLPLGARFGVDLRGSWARGTLTHEGVTTRVEGPTDTEISATLRVGGGASLTGVLLLPTGHSTHTLAESRAAALFASDLLLFQTSNWGSGGGGGVRASMSRRFGTLGAGLSLGYFQARDFSPLAGENLTLRPGSNVVVRGALDQSLGESAKATLVVTFRRYAEDRMDGRNLFRAGDRVQAMGSVSFALGRRATGVVYGGGLHRSGGVFVDAGPQVRDRTYMVAGGGGRFRIGSAVLVPGVDFRALRSSDGIGQGVDTRFGAALELAWGGVRLVPSARARIGRLSVFDAVESGFMGTEFGLSIGFGGGAS